MDLNDLANTAAEVEKKRGSIRFPLPPRGKRWVCYALSSFRTRDMGEVLGEGGVGHEIEYSVRLRWRLVDDERRATTLTPPISAPQDDGLSLISVAESLFDSTPSVDVGSSDEFKGGGGGFSGGGSSGDW